MYSYNLPRSSSTYIFSFPSLAFSDTFFIPSPCLRSLRKKNHSEVRNSSTQKKLTSQCLMDWQGRQDDEAKISSLCSQILPYIVLVILMKSPVLVLLHDQTRSDLSCLPASEENISVNAHFRIFQWKIHELI